jgi:hypothetical protein
MSDRALRRLAWALLGAALAATAAAFTVVAAAGAPWKADVAVAPAMVLAFAGVGLLVVLASPRGQVGWLLVGIGVLIGAVALTTALVAWDEVRADPLAGAALNANVYGLLPIAGLGVLIPRVLLLFPTGAPPTPRWRVVGWAQVAVAAVVVAGLFQPGPIDGHEQYDNPLGVGALDVLRIDPVNLVVSACFVGGALGAVASLVVRFRRSRGLERAQLKWVAWGAAVIGATFVASALVQGEEGGEATAAVLALVLCLFPVTVGVAVLRYRLFEIDRLIARTLVYGLLTVLLGAGYVGLVLATQALFTPLAGGSDLAIAASTLVVAALFLPLRGRVQRLVDRRFYRRRYDAGRTLEAFGARLREQVDLETLQRDLRRAADETVQPAHASVWLRSDR